MPRALVAAALAVTLTACGGDDAGTLERAEGGLAGLDRGVIGMSVVARAGTGDGATGTVGYTLEGSFDTSGAAELPLLDLRYTRLLDAAEQVVEVKSDGIRLAVLSDGVATDVPADQAQSLRLGGSDGPVDGLSLEAWIDEPEETDGPDMDGGPTRRVRGRADAAAVLGDLSVVLSQVSGEAAPAPLDDAAAERLQSALAASSVEVLVGEDDVPRSITVTLDFAGQPPPELAEAFGPLADVGIDLTLTISRPGEAIVPPAMP